MKRFTSMFGLCAKHRQGSSPSVLSRGVLQQSGILVAWSHFRPSNVVLKSIDSSSHTVREIDCALADCTWCKWFASSCLASWAREGGNHKMAICRAAASQSFRLTVREGRRKLLGSACERTRARRPGRRGSEICTKRKFQLWEILGNEMLTLSCAKSIVQLFVSGLRHGRNIDGQTRLRLVFCVVVWQYLKVSVERNRKNANSDFF